MKSRVFKSSLLIVALAVAANDLRAQTPLGEYTASFGHYSATLYAPGNWYSAVVPVDMDQDGDMELLTGRRSGADIVHIWDHDPVTNLLVQVDAVTGFPYDIHDVAAGDVDHDGDIDIAVTLRGYGLYLAINQSPSGSFWGGPWSLLHLDGRYGWQTMMADFDGDGNLDLFHGTDYGYVHMFYGDGSGGFASGPAPAPAPNHTYNAVRGFSVVDLDGDSRLDLIGPPSERFAGSAVIYHYLRAYMNMSTPGTPSWSGNLGPSTFVTAYPPDLIWSSSHIAGDLDADGYVDLVAAICANWAGGQCGDRFLEIYWGGADASGLTWTMDTLSTGLPGRAFVGDVTADGKPDILLRGDGAQGITVFVNGGNRGFAAETIDVPHDLSGGSNNTINIGDLNGDGRTDIVTARETSLDPTNPGSWGFIVLLDTPLLVDFPCFAVERAKVGTKDDKCEGIELLEVTSLGPAGQLVGIYVPEEGQDELPANTVVDDGVNGPESIHTSCSIPLDLGDVYGAYTVTDLLKDFDDDPDAKGNKVDVRGTFTLAASADLALDDVTFTIDDGYDNALVFFIPAGSFELHGNPDKEKYKFHSSPGSALDIKAELDFNKCRFKIDAKGVQGTNAIVGTTMTVGLQVGDNVGQEVVEMEDKKNHLEYKRHPKPQCCPRCEGISSMQVTSDQGVLTFEPEPGRDELEANTVVDDGVNGPVTIHTSCSQPIDIGDESGAYIISDLVQIFEDDG